MSDNAISSTTQEFLDVYDITNDMVILKNGTVSVILQIGTMNFSLLAEQEQDAIMYTYGALLNSLNFPVQINIQSSIKDASRYLRLLDEQAKKASSQKKQGQISRYRNFVAELIQQRNVLEKKFFAVIPATVGEMGLYTAKNVMPGKSEFDINTVEKTVIIEKAANLLDPRRDHLISQFNRIGLYARALDTQEIIQNFYINYNPEASEGQEITNSASYSTPLVRASFSGGNMNQTPTPTLNNQAAPSTAPTLTPTPAPAAAAPTAPATEAPAVETPVTETPAAPTLSQTPAPAEAKPVTAPAETAIPNPLPGQVIDPNISNPLENASLPDSDLEPTTNKEVKLASPPMPPAAPTVPSTPAMPSAPVSPSVEPTLENAPAATPTMPATPAPTPAQTPDNSASFAEEITPLQKSINESAQAAAVAQASQAAPAPAAPAAQPSENNENTEQTTAPMAPVKPVEL